MAGSFNIDWNALKRYTSPQAFKDFNTLLDALPLNVGYNALIAAGMAWLIAGTTVFFTATEIDKVSSLRTELAKVEALKPPVPVIQYTSVATDVLKPLEKKISETYKGVAFVDSSGGATLSATDTDYFPQFLAALGFLQNGGRNWRVSIDSMCVGRDCPTSKLMAVLKVDTAKVVEPPKDDSSAASADAPKEDAAAGAKKPGR